MTGRRPPLPSALPSAATLRARLLLQPVPLVSEISLYRAGPDTRLSRIAGERTPYWAYPWPGGQLLARHLLDRPQSVAGRHVLDLGAGGGLVAIAAMMAGAASATAIDPDPLAMVATAINAEANGVAVTALTADALGDAPPAGTDTVLVGDLFYEPALARRTSDFLDRWATAGIPALVGDIGRADLPLHRLRQLAAHAVPEFGTTGADRIGGVYAWIEG